MDRKYIDDHHIAARYLAEQLDEAEREAFEAYYLQHPDVLRDMEAAARLKTGLAQLRDAGELVQLLKPQPWYRDQRYLAAAAVAAIAVGVGLYGLRSPARQPVLVASSGVVIVVSSRARCRRTGSGSPADASGARVVAVQERPSPYRLPALVSVLCRPDFRP